MSKSVSKNGGGSLPAPARAGSEEVVARPTRRRFTAEYKLPILQEAERCAPGELGALLRREGLYSSHLTTWRKQRETGSLAALAAKKRGPKVDPQTVELARLQRENAKLQAKLARADLIIEAQKKLLVLPTDCATSIRTRATRAGRGRRPGVAQSRTPSLSSRGAAPCRRCGRAGSPNSAADGRARPSSTRAVTPAQGLAGSPRG
jgi:transposase